VKRAHVDSEWGIGRGAVLGGIGYDLGYRASSRPAFVAVELMLLCSWAGVLATFVFASGSALRSPWR
jgi:hypothetical protein